MTRYVVRRVALLVVTLLLTSALLFVLTQLLPGDVARLILGREARPEALEALREQLGLNQPPLQQYVSWLTRFVSGDWGTSFANGGAPIRPPLRGPMDFPPPGDAALAMDLDLDALEHAWHRFDIHDPL